MTPSGTPRIHATTYLISILPRRDAALTVRRAIRDPASTLEIDVASTCR
jgi:hypothetical protein